MSAKDYLVDWRWFIHSSLSVQVRALGSTVRSTIASTRTVESMYVGMQWRQVAYLRYRGVCVHAG